MSGNRQFVLFAACLLASTLALPGVAAAQDDIVLYTWEPPSDGANVVYYMVQMWDYSSETFHDAVQVFEPRLQFLPQCGMTYILRVAGVGVDGVPGPYSTPSESFTFECEEGGDEDGGDLGPPGAPGQPRW